MVDAITQEEYYNLIDDQIGQISVNGIFTYDVYISSPEHGNIIVLTNVPNRSYYILKNKYIVSSIISLYEIEYNILSNINYTIEDIRKFITDSEQPEKDLPYSSETIYQRKWSDLYWCRGAIQFNLVY